MPLLLRLSVLALMMLGMVFLEFFADRFDEHLPWYFLLEVVIGLVPMTWLLVEVMPKASRQVRLAFIVTSAIFIVSASIAELIAIQNRFWWFYQGIDRLTGLKMGDIPLEEFLFYPMFLNMPVLFYLYLAPYVGPGRERPPMSEGTKKALRIAGGVFLVAALALFGWALTRTVPPLDPSIQPAPDAAGAIRYSAGPPQRGWTIVQLFGISFCLFLLAVVGDRLDRRRIVVTVSVFFVLGFFFELMGCGRGWWVWNAQQVSGVFTWVLPVDSYSMYLTGGLLPVLVFEWLRPFFATVEQTESEAQVVPAA